jgi:hypothetical protein
MSAPTATVSTETQPPGSRGERPRVAADWFLGQTVGGDFVLRLRLGQGGLASVYLAHQQSLDRLVALKLPHDGAAVGMEGLALAGLEHDHIVKVYAEVTDPPTGRRGLCLQYVPGTSLEAVIARLAEGDPPTGGTHLLAAIDAASAGDSPFDPTGVRERQRLEADAFLPAVCRLGEQIAHALAFTHARGILHCDIKPGNILLTRYGRPLLADFNVSVDTARAPDDRGALGGTLRYMSPEQMAVLLDGETMSAVDGRTDVYSLGVVLFELATGGLPTADRAEKWGALPRELTAVLRRCLARDPSERYPTAAALADALAAARRILVARSRLPAAGWLGRRVEQNPIRMTFVMALVPEIVGSVLNIAYNAMQVKMTDEQLGVFPWVVGIYDAVAYLVCLWLAVAVVIGTGRTRARAFADPRAADLTDAARRGALRFGRTAIILGLLGWIPGSIVFPTVIDCIAGPIGPAVYGHFAVSFILSALVGIVYSFFGVQFVVLRGLYAYLHHPDTFDQAAVREELTRATRLFGPFVVLATLIPLTGTILLLVFSGDMLPLGFRLLMVGLIALGMAGVSGLVKAADHLRKLAAVWGEE